MKMRELKFRCWNNWGKCFHDMAELVEKQKLHLFDNKDSCYVIEQWTGLKDKNGVDIFEGDIVKWGHIDGFEEIVTRVAVVKLSPSLNFETVNLKNNHAFHYGNFAYARSIDKCMEVIGNIHQNHELLGGE